MKNLHEMTASQAALHLAAGEITSEQLVRACLERIELREPTVAAWAWLDPGHAIRQARARDHEPPRGALHGLPLALKDIIDTRDMPTCYGSAVYQGHQPSIDAVCVAMARAAGAVILGKTVTTEFAGRYPGKTANPHDRGHTPGGSSSGSAAAVADFMVPFALGSQTAGSLIRPAAFCGVYGYKPTFGLLSFAGVKHYAATFDTLGLMARSVDDIQLLRSALLGLPQGHGVNQGQAGQAPERPPRIAFCRTSNWHEADEATHALLEQTAGKLAHAGATVTELQLPERFGQVEQLTWSIIAFEVARNLSPELAASEENLSAVLRQLIEAGRGQAFARYLAHLQEIEQLSAQVHGLIRDYDVVLAPSTAGEAPAGLDNTGATGFISLWHAMGMPAMTVPVATGPQGLPLGVQLVGRRYDDEHVLAVARWISARLTGD